MELTIDNFARIYAETCGPKHDWMKLYIEMGAMNLEMDLFTTVIPPEKLVRLAQAINEVFAE